jgi:hypothetical protein
MTFVPKTGGFPGGKNCGQGPGRKQYRGIRVRKVKKGQENLIRLVLDLK